MTTTTGAGTRGSPAARVRLVGLVGGFFSGLLGIGGGTVMVPLLVLLQRLPQRAAHATSLAAMIVIALAALCVYGGGSRINLGAAAALAPGAVVGARFGARVLAAAPETVLKAAFGLFLVVAAVLMVVEP